MSTVVCVCSVYYVCGGGGSGVCVCVSECVSVCPAPGEGASLALKGLLSEPSAY